MLHKLLYNKLELLRHWLILHSSWTVTSSYNTLSVRLLSFFRFLAACVMDYHDKTAKILRERFFFFLYLAWFEILIVSQPCQSWSWVHYHCSQCNASASLLQYQLPIGCLFRRFSFTDRSVTLSSHFGIAAESQSVDWHVVAVLIVWTPGRIDETKEDLNNWNEMAATCGCACLCLHVFPMSSVVQVVDGTS